eukprot:m.33276 g.33276  ORF g.33276 m.33276 type:complete len:171 (+) comp16788_c0_seq1:119-631(+)
MAKLRPSGTVFVTVGTTSFDSLINATGSTEFAEFLKSLGYNELVVQYGRGDARPVVKSSPKFAVRQYDFAPSLAEDIASAALVISHCGAGTCLECLEAEKALVVVINDELADNHQTELAKQMQLEGYLEYATCSTIKDKVNIVANKTVAQYHRGDPKLFANFLDKFVGFE